MPNKIDSYIHPRNRMKGGSNGSSGNLEVVVGKKGSHELGDKSHIDSLMAEPKGADISGHNGKMHW